MLSLRITQTIYATGAQQWNFCKWKSSTGLILREMDTFDVLGEAVW